MTTIEPKCVRLGGTASHVEVYKVGFGLLGMTFSSTPTPDEQAFETIKTTILSIPSDQKLLVNSGEFYGKISPEANLHLVARFFTKYPELAERMFLSVKGGLSLPSMKPDSTPEGLRRSVDACNAALDGKKRIDLFQCARVDKNVPIEETMKTLKALAEEGKFDHIGMSEIVGIAAVEIEVSPWSYEEETKKVIATTHKLGIPIAAYSPLGRGFLTGLKKSDLAESDWRRYLTRIQDDVMNHNQKIIDVVLSIAEKKEVTAAQLCLAWVCALGSQMVPIPGSVKAARMKENLDAGKVVLSESEREEISGLLDKYPVKGGRYAGGPTETDLWG
ncbi:hypothetical protein FRB96_008529 [Tulasnella sp. 330]|nr:hypothetical protein FRB96_008529 [Tulasnella sp. 330]KAG8879406.1 hypothetical protein FRB97_001633 [Tulasnella sp. 331]